MKWYLASMNDGLFITNVEPRPNASDSPIGYRLTGPEMIISVAALPQVQAQIIVDAHNREIDHWLKTP